MKTKMIGKIFLLTSCCYLLSGIAPIKAQEIEGDNLIDSAEMSLIEQSDMTSVATEPVVTTESPIKENITANNLEVESTIDETTSENVVADEEQSSEVVEVNELTHFQETTEVLEESVLVNETTVEEIIAISDELTTEPESVTEEITEQSELSEQARPLPQVSAKDIKVEAPKYVSQWVFDDKVNQWNYYDSKGKNVSYMNQLGYWIKDVQQFDTVLQIPDKGFYYFGNKEKQGKLIRDQWAYSDNEQKWHYGQNDGVISSTLSPTGYWVNGVQIADTIVEIPKFGYYYFENWDTMGKMAKNKWAYSPAEQKWHYAIFNGLVTSTLGKNGYWIHGEKQFDTVVEIPNEAYYYVKDKSHKGEMAIDEWAFSEREKMWHYGGPQGKIASTLSTAGYWIYGQKQYDTVIEIPKVGYYYVEDKTTNGVRSENKWSYSKKEDKWHKTDGIGKILETFGKAGYWKQGIQQFDKVLSMNNNKYFFERKVDGGKMSVNKWSRSDVDKIWYQSNNKGYLTRRDKYGAKLPSKVMLDQGQWKMWMLYQDGWESGCWLRTAASGINSTGGNQSPFTLIKHIKRTDDPRTGMLSHPSIVNNWNLGGAYSAMWPEALVPVVQKFVPNAADLTGATFEEIKRELANGNTVQIYYAWKWPNIRLNGNNGSSFLASRDYHSILLTGYDSTGFYHQEHWGNPRNNKFSYANLQWQFNAFGKKAISYRKQSILP